jgi:F-type H+-transporting ATPase subunit epsilon
VGESFPFAVYSPFRLFFSNPVEAIVLTLADGEAAVYSGHAPFTAPVTPCLLKIKDPKGSWKTAFTAEGMLEVRKDKTILISDAAEWPEEIDCGRARQAKEKAERSIGQGILKFETDTANASLKRAVMRLRAAESTN